MKNQYTNGIAHGGIFSGGETGRSTFQDMGFYENEEPIVINYG